MTVHYLHLPKVGHLWGERLANAHEIGDILTVANDFIAQMTPAELADLPTNLRPSRMEGAEQVASYALDVVRHRCLSTPSTADGLVCRLALFFSAATLRLAQVSRKRGQEQQRRA